MYTNGKWKWLPLLAAALMTPVWSVPAAVPAPGRDRNFDASWRFHRGDVPGAEAPGADDSAWRPLDLPHDWSIEDLSAAEQAQSPSNTVPAAGPFTADSVGGPATGYTVGGTGWYRKHFTLDAGDQGKWASILFDGVYMDSDVWLNGHLLGNHPYGYTAFHYELTRYLLPPGQENVLAVRVHNLGKNSRWYSGSGIYRHVTLTLASPLHFAPWGVAVTTPEVAPEAAQVNLAVEVENTEPVNAAARLEVKLLGPGGHELAVTNLDLTVVRGGSTRLSLTVPVRSPALWSPEHPKLCRAELRLVRAGREADALALAFGIRSLHFSATDGFTLNGMPVKLRGACVHHDNGPLGAAAIDRAEERRVELLKAQGFNAIRTSHNPPSAVFLDACDRLGMLVLDEAFDCWEKGKNPDDYAKYFAQWWQRDVDTMILRDRNHPSVILWSIGNEIPQRASERGYVIAQNLRDEVHRMDPTRPMTEAICNFWDQPGRKWPELAQAFSYLDVGGYNYEPAKYESDHRAFPERIMMGTESYPAALGNFWPIVERNPYVIGDFKWTGLDYLGEAGCGHSSLDTDSKNYGRTWPWFNAFCGDLDLCGFPKPPAFYRDVVWGRSRLEMMVHRPLPPGRSERTSGWGWPDELPSWTWDLPANTPLKVTVYSTCDAVRLELNGHPVATNEMMGRLKMKFEVPYAPGKLRAVGLVHGKVVAEETLGTTGPAARLRLTADRPSIHASRDDLAYVKVEVTDRQGNVLPDAAVPVRFTVTGAGELAAVGSGSPDRPESFHGPVRTTWHGRALAILRPLGGPGRITLRVEADHLETAQIKVRTAE